MYISSYIFISTINNIKNNDLSKELLDKIALYSKKKNSKINIKRNVLTITCDEVELKVILNRKGVEYQLNKKDEIINKKYVKYKNGYYIKIKNTTTSRYGGNLVDKKQIDTFKLYDKKGIEQYRKDSFKQDSFYENENKELIRIEPNGIDNYKEDSYIWRVEENKILKRTIKKYSYPEEIKKEYSIEDKDFCYIRLQETDRTDIDIPDYGCFYGIDKDVLFKYFQKEVPFEEIIKNFESKKYRIPTTHWI